jgi:hypothetical protein
MPKANVVTTTGPVNIPETALAGRPELARRSFLAGLAVAVPIGATAATAALASPGAARSEVDQLYEKRTELAAQSRELREQYRAAEASMPWWAQPGPSHLRGDGIWRGTDVGWPAVDDDKLPPRADFMLNKRPSPSDIKGDFDAQIRHWGDKRRPEIRAVYRRRMRDLISRLRLQREEEQKAGIAKISAQLDAIGERLSEIDERIENLNVAPADAAQKAAALILITSLYECWQSNDEFGNTATLVALQPFLTGQIREHVDYVIEHPDHEMWAMPFYSAA